MSFPGNNDAVGELFVSGGYAALMCGEPLAHRREGLSSAALPLIGGVAATEKEKRYRKGRAFLNIKAAKPQNQNWNEFAKSINNSQLVRDSALFVFGR